jgi:hypothetical protein
MHNGRPNAISRLTSIYRYGAAMLRPAPSPSPAVIAEDETSTVVSRLLDAFG